MNAAFGNSNLQYSIVAAGDEESILVIIPGYDPLHAHSDHPRYAEIKRLVLDSSETVGGLKRLAGMFDVSVLAAERFSGTLSERISVHDGHVYFDNDPVDGALEEQIVRFAEEGVQDWKPLVAFFEKIATNPQQHAREHLYNWLRVQRTAITEAGDLVLYKGAWAQPDGTYRPGYQGVGIVNGVPNNAREYTYFGVGDVVEMPRSSVAHLPEAECATGLHTGSRSYAGSYGDTTLRVLVNPRDVVNVPDHGQKLRTCRFRVLETVERYGAFNEDDALFVPPPVEPGEVQAPGPYEALGEYQRNPHDLREDDEEPDYDCEECEDEGCEECDETSSKLAVGDLALDPDFEKGRIVAITEDNQYVLVYDGLDGSTDLGGATVNWDSDDGLKLA